MEHASNGNYWNAPEEAGGAITKQVDPVLRT